MFAYKFFLTTLFSFFTLTIVANINVQIVENTAESNCQSNQYCIDLQLKTVDEDVLLGNSSIRFNYDASVLNFEGRTGNQKVGSYASKSYDEDTNCGIVNPYAAHSFDGLIQGDFLISVLLQNTYVNDCSQPLNNEWTTLSTVCFEVLNANKNPNFEIVGSENGSALNTAGTNFNKHTNNALDKPNNGSFLETQNSFNDLCKTASGINQVAMNVEWSLVDIQPVPVKENLLLTIESFKENNAVIEIIDITGKLIKTQQVDLIAGNNQVKINTSDCASGTYIVSIKNDEALLSQKFIKD